jgi:putative nucleotidyltransferase with HDIG domain
MPHGQQQLQQIIDLSLEITQIQDLDVLLEKSLSAARQLVNADAGYIYIIEGETLHCHHIQNDTLYEQLAPGKKLTFPAFSLPINEESIAGYVASTGETLNILDVSLLSDDVPYSFNSWYDDISFYRTGSLLSIPLRNNQNELIGVMHLANALNESLEVVPFSDEDIPLIKIFTNHVAVSIGRAQTTRARILGMVRVLTELHDPEETEAHVNRVGAYSAEIYETWARKKKTPQTKIEADAEVLKMAAMLHDLGKLAIPHHLREKPGRLTAEEYEVIKQHTVKGAQMLLKSAETNYEETAVQIALNHHECWDGSGYPGHIDPMTGQVVPGYEDEQGKPRGKQGEEIPVFGRVVAIADVYDSLSCRRVYREALKESSVLKILERGAGKSFDPEMIDAFFFSLDTIRAIAQHFPDEAE